MRRREWILLWSATLAQGDERQELTDWVGLLAASLSENNPGTFLHRFEKSLRERIADNVRGMLQAAEVSSTVDIVAIAGEGNRRKLELDWFLDLKPLSPGAPDTKRREIVTMEIEKHGKSWRAVDLSPILFFSPPKP